MNVLFEAVLLATSPTGASQGGVLKTDLDRKIASRLLPRTGERNAGRGRDIYPGATAVSFL